MGFRYYSVPRGLYNQLVESKFPPQLLAVVVSDLIPLNLITRGGRHTSSKDDLAGKVKKLTWEQIFENEHDLASGRPSVNFTPLNSADDVYIADLTCEIDFADMDERNGWREPNETPPSPPARRVVPSRKEKGTPVYRITFHGGITISRRMACYWRNYCRIKYNRCKKFIIKKLLKATPPVAPYRELVSTHGPLMNAKINESMEELHPGVKDYIKKARERFASNLQRG
jgi:hypothetical protein